jgi:hypothetical protein
LLQQLRKKKSLVRGTEQIVEETRNPSQGFLGFSGGARAKAGNG